MAKNKSLVNIGPYLT